MFDLYSGTETSHGAQEGERLAYGFRFKVVADADPDVLGRVANQLNIANTAPASATLGRREDGTILIEIELRSISDSVADSIQRKLTQLTCVLSVETVRVI